MSYLDMLNAGKEAAPAEQRGRTLAHPWRGRLVDSPKGRGHLIWTDGYRAAISTKTNMCWFVDLREVNLPEAVDTAKQEGSDSRP